MNVATNEVALDYVLQSTLAAADEEHGRFSQWHLSRTRSVITSRSPAANPGRNNFGQKQLHSFTGLRDSHCFVLTDEVQLKHFILYFIY